jgi:hypothetical protein
MEKLSDVLDHYAQDRLGHLLRKLAYATIRVEDLMLPDGEYSSDDPKFRVLDVALEARDRLAEALTAAYQENLEIQMAKWAAWEADE